MTPEPDNFDCVLISLLISWTQFFFFRKNSELLSFIFSVSACPEILDTAVIFCVENLQAFQCLDRLKLKDLLDATSGGVASCL